MKFFCIGLFLFLVFQSLQGSTIPLKRSVRALNTSFHTDFNGTYQRKNPCTNAEVERSSYKASHEFHHHSKEANWSDYTRKCSAIISSFLQAISELISSKSHENGVFNFNINTTVSQKSDGACLPGMNGTNGSYPTITIEATNCNVSPRQDSKNFRFVNCLGGYTGSLNKPNDVKKIQIRGRKFKCYPVEENVSETQKPTEEEAYPTVVQCQYQKKETTSQSDQKTTEFCPLLNEEDSINYTQRPSQMENGYAETNSSPTPLSYMSPVPSSTDFPATESEVPRITGQIPPEIGVSQIPQNILTFQPQTNQNPSIGLETSTLPAFQDNPVSEFSEPYMPTEGNPEPLEILGLTTDSDISENLPDQFPQSVDISASPMPLLQGPSQTTPPPEYSTQKPFFQPYELLALENPNQPLNEEPLNLPTTAFPSQKFPQSTESYPDETFLTTHSLGKPESLLGLPPQQNTPDVQVPQNPNNQFQKGIPESFPEFNRPEISFASSVEPEVTTSDSGLQPSIRPSTEYPFEYQPTDEFNLPENETPQSNEEVTPNLASFSTSTLPEEDNPQFQFSVSPYESKLTYPEPTVEPDYFETSSVDIPRTPISSSHLNEEFIPFDSQGNVTSVPETITPSPQELTPEEPLEIGHFIERPQISINPDKQLADYPDQYINDNPTSLLPSATTLLPNPEYYDSTSVSEEPNENFNESPSYSNPELQPNLFQNNDNQFPDNNNQLPVPPQSQPLESNTPQNFNENLVSPVPEIPTFPFTESITESLPPQNEETIPNDYLTSIPPEFLPVTPQKSLSTPSTEEPTSISPDAIPPVIISDEDTTPGSNSLMSSPQFSNDLSVNTSPYLMSENENLPQPDFLTTLKPELGTNGGSTKGIVAQENQPSLVPQNLSETPSVEYDKMLDYVTREPSFFPSGQDLEPTLTPPPQQEFPERINEPMIGSSTENYFTPEPQTDSYVPEKILPDSLITLPPTFEPITDKAYDEETPMPIMPESESSTETSGEPDATPYGTFPTPPIKNQPIPPFWAKTSEPQMNGQENEPSFETSSVLQPEFSSFNSPSKILPPETQSEPSNVPPYFSMSTVEPNMQVQIEKDGFPVVSIPQVENIPSEAQWIPNETFEESFTKEPETVAPPQEYPENPTIYSDEIPMENTELPQPDSLVSDVPPVNNIPNMFGTTLSDFKPQPEPNENLNESLEGSTSQPNPSTFYGPFFSTNQPNFENENKYSGVTEPESVSIPEPQSFFTKEPLMESEATPSPYEGESYTPEYSPESTSNFQKEGPLGFPSYGDPLVTLGPSQMSQDKISRDSHPISNDYSENQDDSMTTVSPADAQSPENFHTTISPEIYTEPFVDLDEFIPTLSPEAQTNPAEILDDEPSPIKYQTSIGPEPQSESPLPSSEEPIGTSRQFSPSGVSETPSFSVSPESEKLWEAPSTTGNLLPQSPLDDPNQSNINPNIRSTDPSLVQYPKWNDFEPVTQPSTNEVSEQPNFTTTGDFENTFSPETPSLQHNPNPLDYSYETLLPSFPDGDSLTNFDPTTISPEIESQAFDQIIPNQNPFTSSPQQEPTSESSNFSDLEPQSTGRPQEQVPEYFDVQNSPSPPPGLFERREDQRTPEYDSNNFSPETITMPVEERKQTETSETYDDNEYIPSKAPEMDYYSDSQNYFPTTPLPLFTIDEPKADFLTSTPTSLSDPQSDADESISFPNTQSPFTNTQEPIYSTLPPQSEEVELNNEMNRNKYSNLLPSDLMTEQPFSSVDNNGLSNEPETEYAPDDSNLSEEPQTNPLQEPSLTRKFPDNLEFPHYSLSTFFPKEQPITPKPEIEFASPMPQGKEITGAPYETYYDEKQNFPNMNSEEPEFRPEFTSAIESEPETTADYSEPMSFPSTPLPSADVASPELSTPLTELFTQKPQLQAEPSSFMDAQSPTNDFKKPSNNFPDPEVVQQDQLLQNYNPYTPFEFKTLNNQETSSTETPYFPNDNDQSVTTDYQPSYAPEPLYLEQGVNDDLNKPQLESLALVTKPDEPPSVSPDFFPTDSLAVSDKDITVTNRPDAFETSNNELISNSGFPLIPESETTIIPEIENNLNNFVPSELSSPLPFSSNEYLNDNEKEYSNNPNVPDYSSLYSSTLSPEADNQFPKNYNDYESQAMTEEPYEDGYFTTFSPPTEKIIDQLNESPNTEETSGMTEPGSNIFSQNQFKPQQTEWNENLPRNPNTVSNLEGENQTPQTEQNMVGEQWTTPYFPSSESLPVTDEPTYEEQSLTSSAPEQVLDLNNQFSSYEPPQFSSVTNIPSIDSPPSVPQTSEKVLKEGYDLLSPETQTESPLEYFKESSPQPYFENQPTGNEYPLSESPSPDYSASTPWSSTVYPNFAEETPLTNPQHAPETEIQPDSFFNQPNFNQQTEDFPSTSRPLEEYNSNSLTTPPPDLSEEDATIAPYFFGTSEPGSYLDESPIQMTKTPQSFQSESQIRENEKIPSAEDRLTETVTPEYDEDQAVTEATPELVTSIPLLEPFSPTRGPTYTESTSPQSPADFTEPFPSLSPSSNQVPVTLSPEVKHPLFLTHNRQQTPKESFPDSEPLNFNPTEGSFNSPSYSGSTNYPTFAEDKPQTELPAFYLDSQSSNEKEPFLTTEPSIELSTFYPEQTELQSEGKDPCDPCDDEKLETPSSLISKSGTTEFPPESTINELSEQQPIVPSLLPHATPLPPNTPEETVVTSAPESEFLPVSSSNYEEPSTVAPEFQSDQPSYLNYDYENPTTQSQPRTPFYETYDSQPSQFGEQPSSILEQESEYPGSFYSYNVNSSSSDSLVPAELSSEQPSMTVDSTLSPETAFESFQNVVQLNPTLAPEPQPNSQTLFDQLPENQTVLPPDQFEFPNEQPSENIFPSRSETIEEPWEDQQASTQFLTPAAPEFQSENLVTYSPEETPLSPTDTVLDMDTSNNYSIRESEPTPLPFSSITPTPEQFEPSYTSARPMPQEKEAVEKGEDYLETRNPLSVFPEVPESGLYNFGEPTLGTTLAPELEYQQPSTSPPFMYQSKPLVKATSVLAPESQLKLPQEENYLITSTPRPELESLGVNFASSTFQPFLAQMEQEKPEDSDEDLSEFPPTSQPEYPTSSNAKNPLEFFSPTPRPEMDYVSSTSSPINQFEDESTPQSSTNTPPFQSTDPTTPQTMSDTSFPFESLVAIENFDSAPLTPETQQEPLLHSNEEAPENLQTPTLSQQQTEFPEQFISFSSASPLEITQTPSTIPPVQSPEERKEGFDGTTTVTELLSDTSPQTQAPLWYPAPTNIPPKIQSSQEANVIEPNPPLSMPPNKVVEVKKEVIITNAPLPSEDISSPYPTTPTHPLPFSKRTSILKPSTPQPENLIYFNEEIVTTQKPFSDSPNEVQVSYSAVTPNPPYFTSSPAPTFYPQSESPNQITEDRAVAQLSPSTPSPDQEFYLGPESNEPIMDSENIPERKAVERVLRIQSQPKALDMPVLGSTTSNPQSEEPFFGDGVFTSPKPLDENFKPEVERFADSFGTQNEPASFFTSNLIPVTQSSQEVVKPEEDIVATLEPQSILPLVTPSPRPENNVFAEKVFPSNQVPTSSAPLFPLSNVTPQTYDFRETVTTVVSNQPELATTMAPAPQSQASLPLQPETTDQQYEPYDSQATTPGVNQGELLNEPSFERHPEQITFFNQQLPSRMQPDSLSFVPNNQVVNDPLVTSYPLEMDTQVQNSNYVTPQELYPNAGVSLAQVDAITPKPDPYALVPDQTAPSSMPDIEDHIVRS